MLWLVLVAFGIPVVALAVQLLDEKKDQQRKLDRIRRRLREIENSDD
jgi:uncharacterized protein YcgL (UPF0745 family)